MSWARVSCCCHCPHSCPRWARQVQTARVVFPTEPGGATCREVPGSGRKVWLCMYTLGLMLVSRSIRAQLAASACSVSPASPADEVANDALDCVTGSRQVPLALAGDAINNAPALMQAEAEMARGHEMGIASASSIVPLPTARGRLLRARDPATGHPKWRPLHQVLVVSRSHREPVTQSAALPAAERKRSISCSRCCHLEGHGK